MTLVCHHDFETRSAAELRLCGVYRYAEHPSTAVWCMSWVIGDGPVRRWHPGEPPPAELLDHVARGGVMAAHNAGFERTIWNSLLHPVGWPRLEIAQQDCTMARALAVHLPASLDELGAVLGLEVRKDEPGSKLMKQMAKPRAKLDDGTYRWWDEPEKVERLGVYCDRDVEVEREADKRLPPLSPEERELWELDQRINDRGVAVDVETIAQCVAVREVAKRRADERMAALTGGAVRRVSEAGKLVAWLASRGVPCESVAKGDVADLRALAEALGDDDAVAALDLRLEASKTSTAKFDKMLDTVCSTGRIHGLFAYHRAGPGRWGGMNVQPQNLPRVDEKKDMPRVRAALDVMELFG